MKQRVDFASLLPLTLAIKDLFDREKFGQLPRAISEGDKRTRTYEVGEVIYWSPGLDVAVFYRHDRSSIPSPASSSWARSDSGVEALSAPGSVKVTITHLAFYSGWGNAMAAVAEAKNVFPRRGIKAGELPAASPKLRWQSDLIRRNSWPLPTTSKDKLH